MKFQNYCEKMANRFRIILSTVATVKKIDKSKFFIDRYYSARSVLRVVKKWAVEVEWGQKELFSSLLADD